MHSCWAIKDLFAKGMVHFFCCGTPDRVVSGLQEYGVDCVKPDDCVNIFETAVTPGLDFGPYAVRDVADCFGRYGASVIVFDELADVTGTLTGRVKADDFVG